MIRRELRAPVFLLCFVVVLCVIKVINAHHDDVSSTFCLSFSGSAAIPTDSAARFCNEASRVSPRAAPAGEKGEVLSCCCTRPTASSPAPMIRKCSKSLGFSLLKEAEAAAIPSTESR